MNMRKFMDPLPIPPVLKPTFLSENYTYYEVTMKETKQALHHDMPETTIWGYEDIYPGPTIEVVQGEKVFVK
ncbi:hypothetical protein ACIQZI_07025 [Peribacillus sp. NPDC096379]|uniref:hypothetical protein n=1 Tax=Peribacillus sp. NPDC096379 TaxID=3364393 RepID=UPI0037F2C03F